jgi:hypothetical protein
MEMNEENIDINMTNDDQQQPKQQQHDTHASPRHPRHHYRHRHPSSSKKQHSYSSSSSSSFLNHPAQTAKIIAESLQEPKIALIHRVVRTLGIQNTWKIFQETKFSKTVPTTIANPDGRKKTLGGLFFRLVKEKATKDQYKIIYEIENNKKKEAKKRIKLFQSKQMEKTIQQLDFDTLSIGTHTLDIEEC